jgi:hypothetical protein
MAQKFPYERASSMLAEAEIFGDQRTSERWGVTPQTLYNYRRRASSDNKLYESFTLKKRMILVDWQQDATKTLKIGLTELNRRLPLAVSEEDAKVIHSIAGAIKIVGELKITGEALSEPASPIDSEAAKVYQG